MSNQYLMQKNLNELSRIEAILRQQPNINARSIMSTQHIKLVEEQKRLREQITQDSFAASLQNPLKSDQSLRDNNNYATNNSMHSNQTNMMPVTNGPKSQNAFLSLAPVQQQEVPPTKDRQVTPTERQTACEALKPNGCGPADWKNFLAPESPGGFNFAPACNKHDRNYSTLGYGFERANEVFYQDLMSIVREQTEPNSRQFLVGRSHARTYRNFVMRYGQSYYDKAQKNSYICTYGRRQ